MYVSSGAIDDDPLALLAPLDQIGDKWQLLLPVP